MKKYILILFSIISFWSCKETENESNRHHRFAFCHHYRSQHIRFLMDGWIYVGGRYLNWDTSYVWTYDSFYYYTEEDKLSVNVSVNPVSIFLSLFIAPRRQRINDYDIEFGREELEDGTAFISRFDTEMKIISVTFGNGKRLTNGRFDIHYTEHDSSKYPQ